MLKEKETESDEECGSDAEREKKEKEIGVCVRAGERTKGRQGRSLWSVCVRR